MHSRARIIIPIVLIIALGAGYYWWSQRTAAASNTALEGSGTIEAEDVLITSEVQGRVKQLFVDEGQEVSAGETLVQLDQALLEAQLAQAKAAVEVATANLDLLKAGARPEEIAAAEGVVAQAQAAYDGAVTAYEHAQAILKNPQDLDTQIVSARAARDSAQASLTKVKAGTRPEDLQIAETSYSQAQNGLQTTRDSLSLAKTQSEAQLQQAVESLTKAQASYGLAKSNWEYARDTGRDPIQPSTTNSQTGKRVDNTLSDAARQTYYNTFVQAEAALRQAELTVQQAQASADTARQAEITGVQTAEEQVRAAEATLTKAQNGATAEDLAVAQTALTNAQRTLDLLITIRANPQQLEAQVDAAKAQVEASQAQLQQAQAQRDQVKNGARSEQLQAAEAQLAQAQAAVTQIEVQLNKTTLTAPRDGLVLSRSIHEGEQAVVGAPLMTIGSLDTVRLTLYIAETDIGRVRQGQQVNVTVDSFTDRTFTGTVSFIAQDAQFTPRNVQTKDERATTVFAVRVDVPNSDHALKPGMPADAVIVEQ